MATGKVMIFTGDGHGKTPAALGTALIRAARGDKITIVGFLKGRSLSESSFYRRLEPEIRLFMFEKSDCAFDERTEEQKQDDIQNIRNGLNFARKVLATGECDVLVLDEVLGLVDNKIITVGELEELVNSRESTDIILTGKAMDVGVYRFADEISEIKTVRFKNYE